MFILWLHTGFSVNNHVTASERHARAPVAGGGVVAGRLSRLSRCGRGTELASLWEVGPIGGGNPRDVGMVWTGVSTARPGDGADLSGLFWNDSTHSVASIGGYRSFLSFARSP